LLSFFLIVRTVVHAERLSIGVYITALLAACVMTSHAQQLSIRRYDVSDGLAHNTVTSIYQDKKGYLWFGTFEGLSRFDGYRFTTYDTRDGLGHIIVNHVVEDRQGRLWVATNGGGVSRLRDDPREEIRNPKSEIRNNLEIQNPKSKIQNPRPTTRPKFISFLVSDKPLSNRVNRMLFDSHGALWCLTDFGLYRARATDSHLKFETVIVRGSGDSRAMLEDQQGRLWVGLVNELIEVNQNQVINHGPVGGAGRELITGIVQDRQGRLLVASYYGLFEFIPPNEASQRGAWRQWPLKLKANQWIYALLESSTGALWLGTTTGLVNYQNGRPTEYTTAHGLNVNWVRTLAEDRDGNLWMGTEGGGAGKFTGEMFVSFTRSEGLPTPVVLGTFEDREGRLMAILPDNSLIEIASGRISPRRQLDYPPVSADAFFIVHETPRIRWWANYNMPWVRISRPVLRLRSGCQLALADFGPFKAWPTSFLFYEDETGKLWFMKSDSKNLYGDGQIYRADPARPGPLILESFQADFTWTVGPLMISDRAGGLWLGQREKLSRLWQGTFIHQKPTDGLPEADPRCVFLDSRGWLWIGLRYKGVSMTKEPGAEHPTFVNYWTEQGLPSSAVWSIAEDNVGRLYFGRVRRFASDSLDAAGIAWTFETPPEPEKIKLAPEQRRHLSLIFKEAINNIIRHSDCTSAQFSLRVTDNRLTAEIRDNGCGFAAPDAQVPVGPERQGHGLYSMQARAAELGGQLQIDSAPGHGTHLILVVPLK
jgi:ligand-binding sensor domain-containing protein/anti-sigma regulatory factor (Ser/Thr protein kinase)